MHRRRSHFGVLQPATLRPFLRLLLRASWQPPLTSKAFSTLESGVEPPLCAIYLLLDGLGQCSSNRIQINVRGTCQKCFLIQNPDRFIASLPELTALLVLDICRENFNQPPEKVECPRALLPPVPFPD